MADKITIEILDDGETLKISTDNISMANHGGADVLIRRLVEEAGGSVTTTKKVGVAHVHDGIMHKH
jgi:hypothetical protein